MAILLGVDTGGTYTDAVLIRGEAVLAKAKALGIANARVASSSLDKITGEYLEQEIAKELAPANAEAEAAAEKAAAEKAAAAHQHHELAVQSPAFRHDIRLFPRRW